MELADFITRRILIIDDNEPILVTLRYFLEELGYEVTCFADPSLAIEALDAATTTAVISDIKMPGMTGLQVLEAVHGKDERLPVILMTGHADLTDAINAVKNGAFDFIMKPFDLQYLAVSLERAVRLRAAEEWEKHYVQVLEKTVEERTASLRETIEELTVAKQKAEESSRLKSEFLTNITHEVRTPVNGIVGMIELARTEPNPSERDYYLKYAQESANRLVNVMEGMISFAVVASEQPEAVAVDVRSHVESVISPYRVAAVAKEIGFDLHVADDVPATLQCSKKHLTLLLQHLVENAVKFTGAGMVDVEILVGNSPGTLTILVRDTGTGIPANLRQQVQEPFSQADGSLTRRFEGMGIGLAIVKKILEVHGGTITIDDNPGGGTRVSCSFPVLML